MEWMAIKIKAERIISATRGHEEGGFESRGSFLTQSYPGPALKDKMEKWLEVSAWDRWEFDNCKDLQHLFNERDYQGFRGFVIDLLYGAEPIYVEPRRGSDIMENPQR